MFLKWCKRQGVVSPKLEYPAKFENGLLGIRCTEDIQNREAYLFVPLKMLYTVEKVKSVPVLEAIIQEFPNCFSEEHRTDTAHLILTLGIFYEIS